MARGHGWQAAILDRGLEEHLAHRLTFGGHVVVAQGSRLIGSIEQPEPLTARPGRGALADEMQIGVDAPGARPEVPGDLDLQRSGQRLGLIVGINRVAINDGDLSGHLVPPVWDERRSPGCSPGDQGATGRGHTRGGKRADKSSRTGG
jgi:hypothetical protein